MAQLSRKHFRLFATLLAETCPEGHHIDSVTPLTFKQREINANREEVKQKAKERYKNNLVYKQKIIDKTAKTNK